MNPAQEPDIAAQVPLLEQLRSVPIEWREMRQVGDCAYRNVPYGRMLHEAADTIAALQSALLALQGERDKLRAGKDAAYLERNQVVAALAKCFPSGVMRTAIEGWSEDWHGCVYIDLPTGQASWHYHDTHAYLFAALPPYKGSWDGHTTPEKYARLSALESAERERDAAIKDAERYREVRAQVRENHVAVQAIIWNVAPSRTKFDEHVDAAIDARRQTEGRG